MTHRVIPSLLLLFLIPSLAMAANSCLDCHGSASRMAELSYSHFTVTAAEVASQSGMRAGCPDCHRGDLQAANQDQAHAGLGRLILVKKEGLRGTTGPRPLPLDFASSPVQRIRTVIEKNGARIPDPSVSMLLYQDKRLDTLSQDFAMMEKTCATCHPSEYAEYRQSIMGRNAKQRLYRSWAEPARGPHNCGVWFDGNHERIAAATAIPFAPEGGGVNQRTCNNCHVGCLDCHYLPTKVDPAFNRTGMHGFVRRPPAESCYGGGRGTICHAGPEERRRGAGYFGGPFSYPEGMEPDIHRSKGVGCLDCHVHDGGMGHAMVKRQAGCRRCHERQVASHARSAHRQVSCEACHIRRVAGYQGTYWGPGVLAGIPTPFFKYKDYYGVMEEPILIRDQKDRWIPVKPYPMAVMNQTSAGFQPGLHWRWPKGLPELERTDDAWGYVGLVGGLPENNQALLWIQLDKLSHKYGKSRGCNSCHGLKGGEQRQEVSWDYTDAGAAPFSGRHTVVAGRKGLVIKGPFTDETIEPSAGHQTSAFAPWVYLPNRWVVPGDFSLPALKDMKRYAAALRSPAKARQNGIVHR